jgi:Bax protein
MIKNRTIQFHIFISILLIFSIVSCNPKNDKAIDPDEISTVKTLPESHKKFIVSFYPAAVKANNNIKLDRAKLINLRDDYAHVIVKKRKLPWLNDLAAHYRFGDDFFGDTIAKDHYIQKIDTMLFRVDYIPEKLVMAQAIIESGWGGSKFAKEINNYFGIHCHTPGCGKAASDVENPKFWVKSFPTIEACIDDYMRLLNSGYAFEDLRKTRLKLREEDKYPDAILLAQGLERYSEKGSEYITLIESIINNYLPENLEEFVRYQESDAPLAEK